ncbi:hypothetical protein HDU67_002736 [Dinochytrium kinnereticum]|nr:hypothetical protein HDU67_002736 [Dinochytrium kinnereticum]
MDGLFLPAVEKGFLREPSSYPFSLTGVFTCYSKRCMRVPKGKEKIGKSAEMAESTILSSNFSKVQAVKADGYLQGRSWGSGKIHTEIMFDRNEYDFTVLCYRQRCTRCNSSAAVCKLDEALFLEKVVKRLRIICGQEQSAGRESEVKTPPHRVDLCEACRLGKCLARKQVKNH